jgi:hypothetical protein
MRHEPRGSCALTLQNGRVRQLYKLPKLPFYYSAFLWGNCGKCGKCGKQCAWAEGVTILLLSFLDFKIPRPSAESFLLRI